MNNFKPNKTMFSIECSQQVSSKSVSIKKKGILESLIFTFKFPGRHHLENRDNNNRVTMTHHNYSGNLKTKTSVFEIYLFQIQMPSFGRIENKVYCKN